MSIYIKIDKPNQILDHPCGYCGGQIKGRRKDAKYCCETCSSTEEKRRHMARKGIVRDKRGPNTGQTRNQRAYTLNYKYGITEEQYDQLLEKQNHCCAICDKHSTESSKRLAVDHDHVTGEIRGLLCDYCNYRVVGKHRDGAKLRKIADYVEQGTGWFVPPKRPKRKRSRKVK